MRILIVEDELPLGNLLKANLEAEAYAVDLENDGEQGLHCARVNEYDAIVLDDILPGKCGSEICAELRRRGDTTPILFMSIQGGTEKKVSSLDLGADDYLAKPFAYAEMSARLRALLRRPAGIQSEELRVGGLVLCTGSMSAIRVGGAARGAHGGKSGSAKNSDSSGAERIYLTTKEYSLLRYLMSNAGKLVTRAMIFEHVWSEAANPFSNMIETHIHNLRGKIDAPDTESMIQTVSGRGYVLIK